MSPMCFWHSYTIDAAYLSNASSQTLTNCCKRRLKAMMWKWFHPPKQNSMQLKYHCGLCLFIYGTQKVRRTLNSAWLLVKEGFGCESVASSSAVKFLLRHSLTISLLGPKWGQVGWERTLWLNEEGGCSSQYTYLSFIGLLLISSLCSDVLHSNNDPIAEDRKSNSWHWSRKVPNHVSAAELLKMNSFQ